MADWVLQQLELEFKRLPATVVFVVLAKSSLDKGNYSRVISVCQKGCQEHPNSVAGQVLWGIALIASGQVDEGLRHFEHAETMDPAPPSAAKLIGDALVKRGLFASALPRLDLAVRLDPTDAYIAAALVRATSELGGEDVDIDDTDAGQPAPIVVGSMESPVPAAVSEPAAPSSDDDIAVEESVPFEAPGAVAAFAPPPDISFALALLAKQEEEERAAGVMVSSPSGTRALPSVAPVITRGHETDAPSPIDELFAGISEPELAAVVVPRSRPSRVIPPPLGNVPDHAPPEPRTDETTSEIPMEQLRALAAASEPPPPEAPVPDAQVPDAQVPDAQVPVVVGQPEPAAPSPVAPVEPPES